MTTATDFLRSLTNSMELIDERLKRVESKLVQLDAKLTLVKTRLDAAEQRLRGGLVPHHRYGVGERYDPNGPAVIRPVPYDDYIAGVANAAIAAVDTVFVDEP